MLWYYDSMGFPFNLGKGSCLLKTTTLLLWAKYPFTRFLYISMAIIHSTYKFQQISDKISYQEKQPARERVSEWRNKYLIHIHVHLKPFQCFNNYFQLHLVSFGRVLLLLDDVTAREACCNHEQIFQLTLKSIQKYMYVRWELTFSLPIFDKLGVLASLGQDIHLILRNW